MKNQQQFRNNQNITGQLTQVVAESKISDCPVVQLDASAYTDEQVTSLLFMIEEEKLAGDLYAAFYEQTGLQIFNRIATAEDRHMDSLITLAELAGLEVDGILALPEGKFLNPELETLYAEFLIAGSVSADMALAVGQQVELADIADLEETVIAVVGTPLETIYSHLETGSTHHLAAFDIWLA